MILIEEVAINGSGDYGDGNGGNSDRSGRTSVDWEVEQIRGIDSEEQCWQW
jgi:hypothetical protein